MRFQHRMRNLARYAVNEDLFSDVVPRIFVVCAFVSGLWLGCFKK